MLARRTLPLVAVVGALALLVIVCRSGRHDDAPAGCAARPVSESRAQAAPVEVLVRERVEPAVPAEREQVAVEAAPGSTPALGSGSSSSVLEPACAGDLDPTQLGAVLRAVARVRDFDVQVATAGFQAEGLVQIGDERITYGPPTPSAFVPVIK